MQGFLAEAYAEQYVIHTVCHSWGLRPVVTLRASSETMTSLRAGKKKKRLTKQTWHPELKVQNH